MARPARKHIKQKRYRAQLRVICTNLIGTKFLISWSRCCPRQREDFVTTCMIYTFCTVVLGGKGHSSQPGAPKITVFQGTSTSSSGQKSNTIGKKFLIEASFDYVEQWFSHYQAYYSKY